MCFKQAIVATMMMIAAATSVDKVVVSAAIRKTAKGSKKNAAPTPAPILIPPPAPTPAPILILPPEPTDAPTDAPILIPPPEPTDPPTAEPLLDIPNTVPKEGYDYLMYALWHTPDYLMETLFNTGPFTLFAPTDAAFRLLDEDLFTCLVEPRYWDVLQDVLMYHVADGEYSTEQLVNDQVINMWDGQELLINIDDGTVVINDNDNDNAKVVLPNVLASNGILHGIDRLLMPPEFDAADFVAFCLTSFGCNLDSCPDGDFCNFDDGCEGCPSEYSMCSDSGLSSNGVVSCEGFCYFDDDEDDNDNED